MPGDDDPSYPVSCRIVLAAYQPDALLTGAAALWALGVLKTEPDNVEVLLPFHPVRPGTGRDLRPLHHPQPIVSKERVVAEVDIPFFDVRYGVEVDGPPHLLPAQAARDSARDRMLRRDCDWTIDRFWWFELEDDPQQFVREVVARLRALGSDAVRG